MTSTERAKRLPAVSSSLSSLADDCDSVGFGVWFKWLVVIMVVLASCTKVGKAGSHWRVLVLHCISDKLHKQVSC